jgi:hypothetical protein
VAAQATPSTPYANMVELYKNAMVEAGLDYRQMRLIFHDNACKHYKLEKVDAIE